MFSSSYFSGACFSGAYFSGVSAAAVVYSGAGQSQTLALPTGWRQVTEQELRGWERRARRRAEEERRRRRAKAIQPARPQSAQEFTPQPGPTPDVDRLLDAARRGPNPLDEVESRLAGVERASIRDLTDLLATERRVTVRKIERRAQAVLDGHERAHAFSCARPRLDADFVEVQIEEERRSSSARETFDRRGSVAALTKLLVRSNVKA